MALILILLLVTAVALLVLLVRRWQNHVLASALADMAAFDQELEQGEATLMGATLIE